MFTISNIERIDGARYRVTVESDIAPSTEFVVEIETVVLGDTKVQQQKWPDALEQYVYDYYPGDDAETGARFTKATKRIGHAVSAKHEGKQISLPFVVDANPPGRSG